MGERLPRILGENNQAYARRLHREYPGLDLLQISLLSGARKGNLEKDPAFRALPDALLLVRAQIPRMEGENNSDYARRLHREYPRLNFPQISLLSGVTEGHLKEDPAFRGELPDQLLPIHEKTPRREGENNPAYARRLYQEHPELDLGQISLLSGVKKSNLKRYPAFRAMLDKLLPIGERTPRMEGENIRAYARRLRLQHSGLNFRELSLLSGVTEGNLKDDPTFRPMSDKLLPIHEQTPRREGENNQAYARRLHQEHPEVDLRQISQLSGVTKSNLKRDPAFREMHDKLLRIHEQTPRMEGENNQAYARRLHLKDSALTFAELSLLSGVTEGNLKDDPTFRPMSDKLLPIHEQTPRMEGENNQAYARRLHLRHSGLTFLEISQLSGATIRNLKRAATLQWAPALSTSVEPAGSAMPESSTRRSNPRKRAAGETAPAASTAREAQAIRRVRPRLNEPHTTPIQQLLEPQAWMIAGAMALMRRQGVPQPIAARHAGLPLATFDLVSDEQGRLHPHDMQAALVQAAGADAPRLQELLAYLHREQQRGGAPATPHGTPAATPGLERFAAELQAQLAPTPEHAQPQPDPPPSQPHLAWGARRGRTPRLAQYGLPDPGTPPWTYLDQLNSGSPQRGQFAAERAATPGRSLSSFSSTPASPTSATPVGSPSRRSSSATPDPLQATPAVSSVASELNRQELAAIRAGLTQQERIANALRVGQLMHRERDFITAFVGEPVSDPAQAHARMFARVQQDLQAFNDTAWHRDELYVDIGTVLAAAQAQTGRDLARAVSVLTELSTPLLRSDLELAPPPGQEKMYGFDVRGSVHAMTLGNRQRAVEALGTLATQASELLRRVAGAPPAGDLSSPQALSALLHGLIDEGARRFGDSHARLATNSRLQPSPAEVADLRNLAASYRDLRQAARELGRLEAAGASLHLQQLADASNVATTASGQTWTPAQVTDAFTRGSASGDRNICWFDTMVQLSQGIRRGQSTRSDAMLDWQARQVREASDRLGLSRPGEMFDLDSGAMHLLAHHFGLQVHAFQERDGRLHVSDAIIVGAPTGRPVYLHNNDVHFEPLWPRNQVPDLGSL